MLARAVRFAPNRVPLGDSREIVLVRYRARRPVPGVADIVEGFVRRDASAVRPTSRRVPRYSRPKMTRLTHVDSSGQARMVDVSSKEHSARMARATGRISMRAETLAAIRGNTMAKGDVLGVARVAGIQGAKRTADLIPLCHSIALSSVDVEFEFDSDTPGILVTGTARTTGQTGVEMEAIIAVSVSLVTLYDMAKGVDKEMVIGDISLQEKRGGKSGDWVRGG